MPLDVMFISVDLICGPMESVADGEALARMLRLLHFVGKGDRIVLERDGAAFAVYQKGVLAKTKIASALARNEEGGWRQERPVKIFLRAQSIEEGTAGSSFLLILLREVWRVDEKFAGRHLKAPSAPNDQVARHAGSFDGSGQWIRVAIDEMNGADHRSVPLEDRH